MLAARLREAPLTQSLPPEERIGRFHTVLWISDFLDPLGPLEERMRTLAGAASTAISCKSSTLPRKRWPTKAASNSSASKALSVGSPTAPKACASATSSGSTRTALN